MFQLLKISSQLFLVSNLVMLWILKLWLPVARFKGNVLATLHRSCMQTEQRPLKGALMRQGCWYPSFLLFFFLSLSLYHRKWGTCHWLFLVPDILNSLGSDHIWHSWDVYTQGEVENNQNTQNISFWIHTQPDISNSAVEKRKQYWYINHVTAVICWLHSRECDKVFFTGCSLNLRGLFVIVISKEFSEVTAELSPGLAREKQVVQLGALPLSCSSQACKHSSVGKR